MTEQRRILDLLVAGELTADEAAQLLEALGSTPAPPPPPAPPAPKGIARVLRHQHLLRRQHR